MKDLHFVDTTLRDGQMSLWATGMTTAMMLPIAETLDRAGFDAIEVFANSMEKKLVRELGEDPWERLRLLRKYMPETPLRTIRSRYTAAFHITPRSIDELWYETIAAYGIRQMRTADPSNSVAGWRQRVSDARRVGIDAIVNLIFSISPKHTDDYYEDKARAAAEIDPFRICVKDPGALLTPERVRTLLPRIMANVNGIQLEFHTHCTTGLGTLCSLEALKLGISCINTAIPPLSDASSNPSIFRISTNGRTLGYTPVVDVESLRSVEEHFRLVALRENLPIGVPADYDSNHYVYQVPGGMISNLKHQLNDMGVANRLDEVLEEISIVRSDLGYPIMVTPYSQFVGVQAAMNVLAGERYKVISDEVIQYALGYWGEDESSSIDDNVKDIILAQPRARQLMNWEPPQPSLKELRREYGGGKVSDEEFLLNYFVGKDSVAAMRAANANTLGARHTLLDLSEDLKKNTKIKSLQVQKGKASLSLRG